MVTAQARSQEFAADGANLSPGGQASGTAEPGALAPPREAVYGRGGEGAGRGSPPSCQGGSGV